MKWVAIGCVLLVLLAGAASLVKPACATSLEEKTKHFDIYYTNTPPDGFSGIGQALENDYKEINGYLGSCPDQVKVLVVAKKTMDKVGEHVEAFSAWNPQSSTIVLREETLKDKKSLDVVAKHEICHLGLNFILARKQSKDFSWMEEGICMVLSKEPFSDAKVSKYIIGKGFLSPTEIANAISSDTYDTSKDGYMQSYSLVKYIAQRFGAKALINMLRCPETSFEKAFMLNTGMDFGTFYRQWEGFVKSSALLGDTASKPTYGYLNFDLELGDCAA